MTTPDGEIRLAVRALRDRIRASAGSDPSWDTNRTLKKAWADELDALLLSVGGEGEPQEQENTRVDDSQYGEWSGTAASIQLIRAEAIARAVHFGQFDKAERPYIEHVQRVVAMVDGDDAKALAWLHDVVEDTPLSCAALSCAGISPEVFHAVALLTRQNDDYADYIHRIGISGNKLAQMVKIADLHDHLNPNCPPSLRQRYEHALQTLASAVNVAAVDPVGELAKRDPSTRDVIFSDVSSLSSSTRQTTEPPR